MCLHHIQMLPVKQTLKDEQLTIGSPKSSQRRRGELFELITVQQVARFVTYVSAMVNWFLEFCYCTSRKNCCPPLMALVYGLVAPGTLVNVPVMVGADCNPNAALVQFRTTPLARRWMFK